MTRQSVATLVALLVLGALPAAFIPANAASSEASSQATSEAGSEAAKESGTPTLVKPGGPVHISPSGVYVGPPGPVIKEYGPAAKPVMEPIAKRPTKHVRHTHKAKRWLTWTRKTRK